MDPLNCINCPCCGQLGMNEIYLIIVATLFDLVLKGFALWRAGKNQQLGWFIGLFIINSIGILPLIYLLVVDKKKKNA